MSSRLLPPPPPSLTGGLAELATALEEVRPLRPRHRAQLPSRIAELSEWLTTARDELPRDYLSRPAVLAAYLHYFLPWNIYRQGRLLAGLDLQLAPEARIVDVGAGPLTFALALWLTRPDLRRLPLRYLAIDRGGAALQVGRDLWKRLAQGSGWTMETWAQPAGARGTPAADLLVLANVLNEIHRPGGSDRDAGDDATDRLLERWGESLAAGGRVLVIEPGTRPAARQLVALRGRAIERGWRLLAPCPHRERCPQPGVGRLPWCHFGVGTTGVPPWLDDLSRRAHLAKERASLSFLLLTPPAPDGRPAPPAADPDDVRVVSGPFPLADGGRGRYGCAARGLVLLEEKKPGPSGGPLPGDLLRVTWTDAPRRDGRSGATVVALPQAGPGAATPRRRDRSGT